MTVLTQGIQTGEWLISEGEGQFSRDQAVATVAGGIALPSGTVMGRVTASGKLVKYDNAASDGSQAAVAILYTALPGTNGDRPVTVFSRACEVNGAMLNGGTGVDAPGKADLLALGIIVR